MKFTKLEIPDIIVCEPSIYNDKRGYFTEIFRQDKLNTFLGYNVNFVQENETKSSYGVLRGLHYQNAPHGQTKLVRVSYGAVLDVVVDVRLGSPTFGKHLCIEISAENKRQLFIPAGFAHGFVVLEDNTNFLYRVDNYYDSKSERGIIYNDKNLGIDWQLSPETIRLSAKDTKHPLFENADYYNPKK
jgi:dTDP-4-dehydrorhamnose 3,5-epimerase